MIALQSFINKLSVFLDDHITTSSPEVGAARPSAEAEVPAVTLSMTELICTTVGVGGNPSNLVHGSMPLSLSLDLKNPVMTFPDSETVNLLSEDRKGLQIPHQPLVDINGSSPEYLHQNDISVNIDSDNVPVTQTIPGPGQCRLNGTTGILEFGTALGATGSLLVQYRIGQWEAETTRCTGLLQVDIFEIGKTKTADLSDGVAIALSQKPQDIMGGLTKLSPVTWGAIERPATPIGNTMLRTLSYSFIFDHEQPVLSTGGGPIRVIDVRSEMGPEHFLIKKRNNHE